MSTLKVRPLEWFMRREEMLEEYKEILPVVNRDGYYCCGKNVWFEYDGRAYTAFPRTTPEKAAEYFCHTLTVNDEAILRAVEVAALKDALRATSDRSVRKAISKRLKLHDDAVSLRAAYRTSRMYAERAMKRVRQKMEDRPAE